MSEIKLEIAIDAKPEKVWEVLGDFGNVYKWSPAIRASASVEGHERGGDAIRSCELPGFGSVNETVTEWSEGEGFTYLAEATGPVKTAVSGWRVRSEGAGSVVTVAVDFKVRYGILGTVMDRLIVRRMLRRIVARSLAGLRHYVMTGEEVGDRLPEGVGTENVREAAETVAA